VKLSIIIPTLNEEQYLPILLSEIKKQDFKDLEIIVADAGSEDRTLKIAKDCGCKIVSGGLPAKGRNEGAKAAQGAIFLFLDADNLYLPPGFLKKLLAEFERRGLDIASFPVFIKGNPFDFIAYWIYNKFVQLTQKFSAYAFSAVLAKREIHQKINGFDEEIKLGEDHDFAQRGSKAGRFGFIKTRPVLTSARRFERDGRFKTYSKYVLAGFYIMLWGPIKSDIFKYRLKK
jgi:glycosyltransferase involved in cell wall biosynthesis